MSQNLKAALIAAVERSRTDINVADRLYTLLSETNDWREKQQIQGAIRHAERNARSL